MGMDRMNAVTWGTWLIALICLFGCKPGEDNGRTWREGGGQRSNREEEAVPVEITELTQGRIESILRFSATLEAEREVDVFAEATRKVEELLVEEGDQVRKGDVLVRLQDEEQRSAVAKAEMQLAQTEREYERQKRLFAQDMTSEQMHNDALYQLEQAQLTLSDARRELGYTEITAPIDGTITQRWVNLGDTVTLTQPLFHMVDFDSIVARIWVPEKELTKLSLDLTARLRADAVGTAEFDGRVTRISPVVDPGTGTVKVTVSIPRQQGLRPGMYVEVSLVTDIHEQAVLIPKRALVYDNDRIFVFRLDDGLRVERVEVVPLLENNEFIEPTEGLAAGDRIVVAGQAGLKDGALVKLTEEAATQAPEPQGESATPEQSDSTPSE